MVRTHDVNQLVFSLRKSHALNPSLSAAQWLWKQAFFGLVVLSLFRAAKLVWLRHLHEIAGKGQVPRSSRAGFLSSTITTRHVMLACDLTPLSLFVLG